MGIKHFFKWAKNNFSDSIYQIGKDETLSDIQEELSEDSIEIDNFMIDMNGIFHNSAQKIYQYGNYKPQRSFLMKKYVVFPTLEKQQQFFADVCIEIDKLVNIVKPRKRLILCVDGPAPLGKQQQQRQRRYVSASNRESNDRSFDSNAITPGTKLMDYLSKYIDWYIRKKISTDKIWENLQIVFSNEKVPAEGEAKAIAYIRRHHVQGESYCIHGMDADLIMLTLGTHIGNFYILRQEMYDPKIEFHFIHVGGISVNLAEKMRWESEKSHFIKKNAINDFIFMCFSVGNDFLPHIPAIEIIENGIDIMLDVYRTVGEINGHLTRTKNGSIRFSRKSLSLFLKEISKYEEEVLINKLSHKGELFPDPLLEKHSKFVEGKYEIDMVTYRKEYYDSHFKEKDIKKLCHSYLDGMQWVITYYIHGVPDWSWKYEDHYAPFACDLAKHVKSYVFKDFNINSPTLPFVQLLSVLPPKSANLLPSPLSTLLTDHNSPLRKFCPEEFDIDLSGKRQEWEGIALLPMIDREYIEDIYQKKETEVPMIDKKRNIFGKNFLYRKSGDSYLFKSFYGDFISRVETSIIDF